MVMRGFMVRIPTLTSLKNIGKSEKRNAILCDLCAQAAFKNFSTKKLISCFENVLFEKARRFLYN
jgi:hypothetical protein